MRKPNIALYLLKDLDSEIARRQAEIQRLEAERDIAMKRESATKRATEVAIEILEDNGLTLADLFRHHKGAIRTWIKAQKGQRDSIWWELRSHFMLHGDAEANSREPAKPKPVVRELPELPIGEYVNPFNEEVISVTEGKLYPDELNLWVQRYGYMTVEGWRVNKSDVPPHDMKPFSNVVDEHNRTTAGRVKE